MTSFNELYPFKSNYLDIDGLKYHYLDEGEGPVILMLHGNPSWSFYYRELIKAFSKTHRVIAPDNIGHGLSDKPQDPNYYRLKNHVSNVKRLIAHLKIDEFDMFVHDWGGPIGLGTVVDMPEKLKKIVVFNSTCELDGAYPWQIRMCRIPFFGEQAVRRLNLFAWMAATIGITKKKLDPDVKAGLMKPYDSYENRIGTYRFVMDIPYEKGHPTKQTGSEIMAKMDGIKDTPALICWGMKDICFTPKFLGPWMDLFTNHEVHRFSQAGHYVVEEEIEEIIKLAKAFI